MKRLDGIARRRCLFAAVLALAVVAAPSAGWSQATCNPAERVKVLIRQWADALANPAKKEPPPVVDEYDSNAILLPTCSEHPAIGTAAIRTYFVGDDQHRGFLSYEPKVTDIGAPTAGGDCSTVLLGSGLYTFALKINGEVKTVRARYTYVFQRANASARWLITQHHSSLVPKVQGNTCP
jgi:hypothetical protein